MKRALLLLAFLPGFAQAASLTVDWVNPTTALDGTPLTGAQAITSIQIFLATSPIADNSIMAPTVTLTSVVNTTNQTFTANVGQTIYVRLKVCNQWGCGNFSNQASKVVAGSAPNVPTSVTITINVSP